MIRVGQPKTDVPVWTLAELKDEWRKSNDSIMVGRAADGTAVVWNVDADLWLTLPSAALKPADPATVVLCENEAEFARWLLEGPK